MGAGNQVRLIGGRHRGRRLSFVPGRGLRPTPDRVRETLFNWLRADVHGAHCLDLFAGSGALGLEALSRGAASVTLIERNRSAAQRLRENLELLGEQATAEVVQADALRWLALGCQQRYDIVFIDPPFADDLLGRTLQGLFDAGCMSDPAMVYIEQDANHAWPDLPASCEIHREGRAGQSAQRLLRCSISG